MNYLSVIYKEHEKSPYHFGKFVGRTVVWKRLLGCILEELKINHQDIGTIDFLYQVENRDILERMIKNLCENINKVRKLETEAMLKAGMLKFIIMEIWYALEHFYNQDEREGALRHFLGLIHNDVAIGAIKSMDKHFREHHLRDDPSINQF